MDGEETRFGSCYPWADIMSRSMAGSRVCRKRAAITSWRERTFELVVDTAQMPFHGVLADEQRLRDLDVALAQRQLGHHRLLLRRQSPCGRHIWRRRGSAWAAITMAVTPGLPEGEASTRTGPRGVPVVTTAADPGSEPRRAAMVAHTGVGNPPSRSPSTSSQVSPAGVANRTSPRSPTSTMPEALADSTPRHASPAPVRPRPPAPFQ